MRISLDTKSVHDYERFLKVKALPRFRMRGGFAEFPDEYASVVNGGSDAAYREFSYTPPTWAFDYQRDISAIAIAKKKYAVFADCGLGKTIILLEFARHVAAVTGKPFLIVCPLMVVQQTIDEARRFYGGSIDISRIPKNEVPNFVQCGSGIGITNFESIDDSLESGNLGGIGVDESSMLKSHYGKWGTRLIEVGRGLEYIICLTGTPAPNDRIEYANHAVLLGQQPTVNAFLARYFVNRGQTDNRWELKPHAVEPFYRDLSHWSIFLTNPATYGWKDNTGCIPPINVHLDRVELTPEQSSLVHTKTGQLFADKIGGVGERSRLAQIAKGYDGEREIASNKPAFIREMVNSWPGESTIIWCRYNHEQELMERTFSHAISISGDTPYEKRHEGIEAFKRRDVRVMISKPRVLGLGLNLQVCTRQVFSGLQDSYEEYYQAVKRSNRIGSTLPLNVHIPYTDIEAPMIQTVLDKAKRVQHDTEEQERIFRKYRIGGTAA